MKIKTKKWTLFTALATAFVSVLSLAFAVMPKTTTAVAQHSNHADYQQAISVLEKATKYTVSADSVYGNMTIGGGDADAPAPIGTKMYFSYTVEDVDYAVGSYEEGLSVYTQSETLPFATRSFEKGLARYEVGSQPYLLKKGHTYYCIIEKTSGTSFVYNIYKNEGGSIRLAFANSDNELWGQYGDTSTYPLSENGCMGLYVWASDSNPLNNLVLTDVSACYVDANGNLVEGEIQASAGNGFFTVAKPGSEEKLMPDGVEDLVESADKYVVQGQVNGNLMLIGGDANNIAPLGTKMYFSYKVSQIEKCVQHDGWLEEGVTVSGAGTGDWIYTHGKTLFNAYGTGALFKEGCTYYAEIVKTANDDKETGANENDFTAKIYMKDKDGNVFLAWDSEKYNANYDHYDSKDFTMEEAPYFGLYIYADMEGLVLSDVCAVYEKADGSLVQGTISVGGDGQALTVMEQPESVTVNVVAKDGSEISTQTYEFGDRYTLPTSQAAYFLGWSDGKALYNSNDVVALYNDVTITEMTFEFKTMVGAGIRVADPSGIRFGTLVNKADWDKLVDLGISVATGTLITPTDYLADENVFEGESSLKSGKTLKDIENDGFAKTIVENDVEYYVYYGSLVNLQNHNYARAFSGTSYAILTIAGEETTIYGGYTKENQSRSIYQVAKAVLADDTLPENGTQKTAAKAYVDSVVMATVEGTTVTMDENGSTAYEVTVAGTTVTVTAKEGGDVSNVKSIVLNGCICKDFNVANGTITLTLPTTND